jgi:hypothetical protein
VQSSRPGASAFDRRRPSRSPSAGSFFLANLAPIRKTGLQVRGNLAGAGRQLWARLRSFRIPDFPLGALFASIMATIAILFAFPELASDWIWWILVLVACIVWRLGAGFFHNPQSPIRSEPEAPKGSDTTQIEPNNRGVSADAAAIVDAMNRQEHANRAQAQLEDDRRRTLEQITMFIVFVTAGAIIMQVSEMRKIYGPISAQAKASLAAASAAHDQTDALLATNRPWVSGESVEIIRDSRPPNERGVFGFAVGVKIRNTANAVAKRGFMFVYRLSIQPPGWDRHLENRFS